MKPLALSKSLTFALLPRTLAAAQRSCDAGLHLIVARGSGAPPGTGKVGYVATAILQAVGNSSIAPLDYPATADTTQFQSSVAAGVVSLMATIKEYSTRCPDGRIALIGNSQGAQVTANTVCGTYGVTPLTQNAPINSELTKNVVAVLLFGDPSHVGNMSWNAGTSVKNGIVPRINVTACDPYVSKTRSWCDTGDVWCDLGNDQAVHDSYFKKYEKDAVDFVKSKLNGARGFGGYANTTTATGGPSPPTTTGSGTIRNWTFSLGYLWVGLVVAVLMV